MRKLLVTAALLLLALSAAGCGAVGRVGSGDVGRGKQLFLTASNGNPSCASCHTLADAKAAGTVGPDLDDAFSSDKTQGFSTQTMADIVRGQIAYPEEPMPANLYRGQDARDVALYVAKCAGKPDCGVAGGGTPPPPAGGGGGGGSAAPSGKQVFTSAGCAGCHTLKDAGATGTVGPDLDQLKPPKAAVVTQVTNGGGGMPPFKGQLSAAQIDAVATYVSSVAGK